MAALTQLLGLCGLLVVPVHAVLLQHPRQHYGRTTPNSDETTAAAGSGVRAVVHFLFMLDTNLPHAEIWGKFFTDAPRGSWVAWAHCKNHLMCYKNSPLADFELRVVPQVPSEWKIDEVSPMVHMLKSALYGPRAFGSDVMQKFIILGNAMLPIKPFPVVYQALTADDESDFCFNQPGSWATALIDGHMHMMPKHHRWVVLNGPDARMLVDRWKPVQGAYNWSAPLANGTWMPRTTFNGGSPATDEEAVYALTHGTIDLLYKDFNNEVLQRFARRRCRTYVIFPGDLPGMGYAATSEDPRVATTAKLRLDRSIVMQHIVPGDNVWVEPTNFWHVGRSALNIFRSSPYLFARRFPAGAVLKDFASVMFAAQGA